MEETLKAIQEQLAIMATTYKGVVARLYVMESRAEDEETHEEPGNRRQCQWLPEQVVLAEMDLRDLKLLETSGVTPEDRILGSTMQ